MIKNNNFIFLVAISLLAGCSSPRVQREIADMPMGKGFQPQNIFSVDDLGPGIRRVVVLPFNMGQGVEGFLPEIENAMIIALQRQRRFQVVRISQQDLFQKVGTTSFSVVEPISIETLNWLQERYLADAVLQVHITAFRPYKPILLGIQSRLFSLPDRRILWSCDEVFDAGNKDVLLGARVFAEKDIQQPYPLQSSYSTVLSPQRFASYVGHALFATLPGGETDE